MQPINTSGNHPRVYPIPKNLTYLPYPLQHAILTALQRTLEESCFYFAKKWLPAVLKKNNWLSPEAGELNLYCIAFGKCHVPSTAVDNSRGPLMETFNRVKQVRHSAVHRNIQLPIVTIDLMLKDGVRLTTIFKDEVRASQIQHWQSKIRGTFPLIVSYSLFTWKVQIRISTWVWPPFPNRPLINVSRHRRHLRSGFRGKIFNFQRSVFTPNIQSVERITTTPDEAIITSCFVTHSRKSLY